MAIQIFEKAERETVSGRDGRATLRYFATGTHDERAIRDIIFGSDPRNPVPLVFDGLLLMDVRLREVGPNWIDIECDYGIGERVAPPGVDPLKGGTGSSGSNDSHEFSPADPIPPEFSIDGAGASIRIYTSISTSTKGKRKDIENQVPDFKGAIGVSKNGVEGLEVTSGEINWSETWVWPRKAITWKYVRHLANMADHGGTYHYILDPDVDHNPPRRQYTWRTFPMGEVRFYNFQITSEGLEKVKITYYFNRRKNDFEFMKDLDFVDEDGQPITKLGQQYAWVLFEEKVQTVQAGGGGVVPPGGNIGDAEHLVTRPSYVYIEEVYHYGDLADLGIGK